MTFGEARDILRSDILAESATDYFSDAELLDFCYRAAREIGGALEFPRVSFSTSVAANANTVTIPSGVAVVNEVTVGPWVLAPAPRSKIQQYRLNTMTIPRFYSFDRRLGGRTVQFAPAAPASTTAVIEYVDPYDTSAFTTATEIWNGEYPQFHELVTLRAAEKAFRASLEMDKAQAYAQLYQAQYQEFVAFLSGVNIGDRQIASVQQ